MAVLRPMAGLDYERITSTSPQSEQAALYLARYASGADLVVGLDAVLSDIAWDEERTDDAEAAVADLGRHLGFVVQQPELIYGRGSDVLWAMGGQRYAVIEVKTGATAPLIWKKDINQLAGSVNWCATEYGIEAKPIPVMLHPSNTVEGAGTPPVGTRVLTKQKLKGLTAAVRSYARAVAHENQYRSAAVVRQQLEHHKLTAATFLPTFTEAARREPKKA